MALVLDTGPAWPKPPPASSADPRNFAPASGQTSPGANPAQTSAAPNGSPDDRNSAELPLSAIETEKKKKLRREIY